MFPALNKYQIHLMFYKLSFQSVSLDRMLKE